MFVRVLTILAHSVAVASSFSLFPHDGGRASSTWLQAKASSTFDEKQADFCRGYLNKHHADVLCLFAEAYSEIGVQKFKRNSFSGGSYKLVDSQVTNISCESMELEVTIIDRSMSDPVIERVTIPLDTETVLKKRDFIPLPPVPDMESDVDNLVRKLNRLCNQVKRPDVTGKIVQMGIQFGSPLGALKENMWLNQVPHNRYVREYFYDMASEAVMEAVVKCASGEISNRMKMVAMFPEMNPSMDSYR